MWHVWVRREVNTGFWWGRREGKRPLGRPRNRQNNNTNVSLQEMRRGAWIGLIRLSTGTDGGLL